jgi:hypothetical protein
MKYIFVTGAPGSKWSSVVKNIYYSSDIDRSDYRAEWTYYHDASGTRDLMHLGAYFDPGMECDIPEMINEHSREELEALFDRPFEANARGTRIIKSHVFSNHIDFIRNTWPDAPIVLVHRGDDACLGWWVKCGHFDITYPLYHKYYRDLKNMAQIIRQQNKNILDAWWKYNGKYVTDNIELAQALKLENPPPEYRQNYVTSDIRVKVI